MRKYRKLTTLLIIILFWLKTAFSNQDIFVPNTDFNIKWAYLMEQYSKKLVFNLVVFEESYNIKNDKYIQNTIYKLNNLTTNLKKIQNYNIDKYDAEKIMRAILSQLRELNNEIKISLKKKKDSLKIEKINYSSLTSNLALKLDKIIVKLTQNNNNDNKLDITKNIESLKSESKKLKNFDKNDFINNKEVVKYLKNILQNIKKELNTIKILLRN